MEPREVTPQCDSLPAPPGQAAGGLTRRIVPHVAQVRWEDTRHSTETVFVRRHFD